MIATADRVTHVRELPGWKMVTGGNIPTRENIPALIFPIYMIRESIYDLVLDNDDKEFTLSPKFNRPTERPPSTTVK